MVSHLQRYTDWSRQMIESKGAMYRLGSSNPFGRQCVAMSGPKDEAMSDATCLA